MNIDPLKSHLPDAPAAVACSQDKTQQRRLAQATMRFEGFFVTELLKQMRRSTAVLADQDSALNDRVNADMLDFADQAFGDTLAAQRAFGIADALLRQLQPATPSAACNVAPATPAAGHPLPLASRNPT